MPKIQSFLIQVWRALENDVATVCLGHSPAGCLIRGSEQTWSPLHDADPTLDVALGFCVRGTVPVMRDADLDSGLRDAGFAFLTADFGFSVRDVRLMLLNVGLALLA